MTGIDMGERIPSVHLKGQPDHVWLREIGKKLYGERWLRPFAAALGVDHTTLLPLVREDNPRPMTVNMRDRLDRFLIDDFHRLIQEHRNMIFLMAEAQEHFGLRKARLPSTSK